MTSIQILTPKPNAKARLKWATDRHTITPRSPMLFPRNASKYANPDRPVKREGK